MIELWSNAHHILRAFGEAGKNRCAANPGRQLPLPESCPAGLAISAILTSGAIEGIAAEWRKA